MPTDIWFRDPYNYVQFAAAEGIDRYVLSKSHLMARRIDPISFMRKHFLSTTVRPEFMTVGREGAALYDLFSRIEKPKAFWPVWSFDDSLDALIELLASPVGGDEELCNTDKVNSAIRPVFGQPHRIVITDVGNQRITVNKNRLDEISQLIKDFPECSVHISGSYTFRVMFTLGFDSADFDPWSVTRSYLSMPSGFLVYGHKSEEIKLYEGWINMLGFTLDQLATMKERLYFNVRSIKWASKYYDSNLLVKRRYSPTVDDQNLSDKQFRYKPPKGKQRQNFENKRTIAKKSLKLIHNGPNTDGIICDGCIFRNSCKLAREGSICVAGASQVGDLAKYFNTRDPGRIVDGLGKLMEIQATRLEEAIEKEQDSGEENPEITKQLKTIFDNGVKLAKVLDPKLNGNNGTTVNILNAGGVAAVSSGDPRQMVAAAVRALEDAGIPRKEITNDMIAGLLSNMAHGDKQQAIEAKVIEHEEKKST